MVSSNTRHSESGVATAQERRLVFPSQALAQAREFAALHAPARPQNHRGSMHATALRGPAPIAPDDTTTIDAENLVGSIEATFARMQRSLDQFGEDARDAANADATVRDNDTPAFAPTVRGLKLTLRPDPSTPPPRSAA
jgi:hypothetical protein